MRKGSVHFRILCAVPNNRASVLPFFRLRINSFSLNQAESSDMAFDKFAFISLIFECNYALLSSIKKEPRFVRYSWYGT